MTDIVNSLEPARLLAGRYRLSAIIGQGGMGTVWRARDEQLGRDVAVKEIVWPLRLGDTERETARRRAVREAQMAARLHHPNVVGIYDIFEEDDRPWIVMELVPYRSLRDVVRQDGPLAPDQAARLGLGILAGLRAAHAEGIVHRDVKPANILVGPGGRAVLTDFGIARGADSPALTASGVLVGSPSYIAPERARGREAGTAGDMWGLGASLYMAVEGQPPFERDSVLASLTAVVTDEPEPAVHAGPLGPVIGGLLRKDPGERYGAAEADRMLRQVTVPAAPLAPSFRPAPRPAALRPTAPRPAAPRTAVPPLAAPGPRPPRRRPPYSRALLGGVVAAVAVLAAAAIVIALVVTNSAGSQTISPTGNAHRTAQPSPATRHQTAPRPAARRSAASDPAGQPSPAATPRGPAARPSGPAAPPSTRPGSPSASPPASPSAGSSASPSGSSPANSSGSPPASPVGYYRFTSPTGFSIGVPQGWQVSRHGHQVYIQDPANSGVFLLIDRSNHPDPGGESTYDENGVLVHVLTRIVPTDSHRAYTLSWSTPASDWDASYHYFQTFAATFRPAP